jgi:hypothetical protein
MLPSAFEIFQKEFEMMFHTVTAMYLSKKQMELAEFELSIQE